MTPSLPLTYTNCQESTSGVWQSAPQEPEAPLFGGAFDSRNLQGEQIFFAFTFGAQDGHQFVHSLAGSSVKLLVVEKAVDPIPGIAILQVPDSLAALHQIAAWRAKNFAGKIVSLTGSSGKTTVKNWLVHFLGSSFNVQANPGSFNNHIGCPVTLLSVERDTELLVLEMGTSGPGELDLLSSIAPADITLLLNIGHAHLGKFGSLEGLKQAKLEIFRHPRLGGVNIAPQGSLYDKVPGPKTTFGASGDYWVDQVTVDGAAGEQSFVLHTPGNTQKVQTNHLGPFVPEMLAALRAVYDQLGGNPEGFARLASQLPEGQGRSQVLSGPKGSRLINDSYNANPESVVSLWQTMAAFEGQTYLACIGNLAEMDEGLSESLEVMTRGMPEQLTDLFVCGETAPILKEAFAQFRPRLKVTLYANPLEMKERALELAGPHTVIGVKGSRTSHMERLVLALTGTEVDCALDRCGLLLNCVNCSKLNGEG